MQTINNPGSANEYLAEHEGQTTKDYLETLDEFKRFVTRTGLADTDLLNQSVVAGVDTEEVTAA